MILKSLSTILFFYPVSSLWDKVIMESGMTAKTLPEPENFTITADETTFFHREMTHAISLAYDLCHKLSTNLPKGLITNADTDLSQGVMIGNDDIITNSNMDNPATPVKCYGFFVRNLQGHYEHSLRVIDDYIEKFIVDKVIQEWWLKCQQGELYKAWVQKTIEHKGLLNNSMYSLYKPVVSIGTSWAIEDVTVELETGDETTTSTEETPEAVQEVLYFDTYADFPAVGVADMIYVDRATTTMYKWDTLTATYVVYGGVDGEYSVNYYDTDSIVVTHNLGKMSPYVEATDADGNTFEPLWTPVDVNSGTASWNTVGSGILRFS